MGNEHEFLNYFKKPLSDKDIMRYYKISKIEEPKLSLVRNVVTSLLTLIHDTYLGDDKMDDTDKENHFEWCWNKLNTDLKLANIDLNNKVEFKNWIKTSTFQIFYDESNDDKEDILISMKELWSKLLNMDGVKTKSDIDLLIDVYNYYYKTI